MNYKQLLFNQDRVLSIYPELAVILNIYDEIKFDKEKNDGNKRKKPDRSGLNKAIVINQLNYWNGKNENKNRHYIDGYFWSYNTYAGWAETNFPFWSPDTVKRIFTSLERDGLIVSRNYNHSKIDNTKWYRVDYEKLQEIIDIVERYSVEKGEPKSNMESEKSEEAIEESKCEPQNALTSVQNAPTSGNNALTSDKDAPTTSAECPDHEGTLPRPIPENNYIDYTSENNHTEITTDNNFIHAFNPSEKNEGLKEIHASCCHTKPVSAPKKKRVGYLKPGEFTADDLYKHLYQRSLRYCLHNGKDEYDARDFARVIHYFYMAYKNKMGHDHPFLNDGAFERVADAYFHPPEYIFDGDLTSVDNYAMMIDRFLETNFGERKKNEYGYGNEIETDPTISLFMSSEFREHIAMHLFEEP